jgi:hypothetical protein
MRVVGVLFKSDILCNYCQLHISECPKANHIKFGNGVGNDNVIECSEFLVKQFVNDFSITGMPEYGIIKGGKQL